MTDPVLIEQHGPVLVITINRARQRNAVNRAVSEAIAAALDTLDARDDLRAGVLTGQDGNFCSGMDLKAFVAGERPELEGRGFGGLTEKSPVKPLIAAVEGYALAGGFEAVLACDLLVASRTALFGLPEAKRGLLAAAGGLLRLPRLIAPRIAMEMALTGDMVSAERLERYGLVNLLVEPGQALAAARTMARSILANAPLSVERSKRLIVEQRDWSIEEMFARQAEVAGDFLKSNDAREGAAAFVEKRKPRWTGT